MTDLLILSIQFKNQITKSELIEIFYELENNGFELQKTIKTYEPLNMLTINDRNGIIDTLLTRSDSRAILNMMINNNIFDFNCFIENEYIHIYRTDVRDGRLVGNNILEVDFYKKLINLITNIDISFDSERAGISVHRSHLQLDFEKMTFSTLNLFDYIYGNKEMINQIQTNESELKVYQTINIMNRCLLIINGVPLSI